MSTTQKVQAQYLQTGDVTRNGETIVSITKGGLTIAAGKTRVALRGKSGGHRITLWNSRTEIKIERATA